MAYIAWKKADGEWTQAHLTQDVKTSLCGVVIPDLQTLPPTHIAYWMDGDRIHPSIGSLESVKDTLSQCAACQKKWQEIRQQNTWLSPGMVYRSQWTPGSLWETDSCFPDLPGMPSNVDHPRFLYKTEPAETPQRVQVRRHAHYNFKGSEECADIMSLWFRDESESESQPFMVYIREGDNGTDRYYHTDRARLLRAQEYLTKLYYQQYPHSAGDRDVPVDVPIENMHLVHGITYEPSDLPEGGEVEQLVVQG